MSDNRQHQMVRTDVAEVPSGFAAVLFTCLGNVYFHLNTVAEHMVMNVVGGSGRLYSNLDKTLGLHYATWPDCC